MSARQTDNLGEPTMITRTLLAALAAVLVACAAQAADSDSAQKTRKLVAVLQTSDSTFEKARACQQLGEIGTRDAVPALAALLASPELSAYARSGLEGIPDPSAAAALRDAAARLNGPLLIGVVNSLGTLRDEQAVHLLGKLAADPGSGAAKEALLALGNISSPQAIRILQQALTKGPDSTRADAAAACLLAADQQRTGRNLKKARELYELVLTARVPVACRVGATRGAILAREADRVPFLMEQLRSGEPAIRNAALLTIREIPDDTLTAALNAELPRARPELQSQLLLALADCHNAQTIPAVETLANGANAEVRRTALVVLGQIGPDAAPALLAALQKDQTAEDKSAVLNGLKAVQGAAVDDLLLRALGAAAKPGTRIDLIRLLSARGAVEASGEFLKQAAGPDKEVNLAALSALQTVAGAHELPGLMALIKSCQDDAVRDAAENALAGACSRSAGPPPGAEVVFAELKQVAKPAEKNSWIRVLAAVGYAKALPAIEAAASDPDEAVADNALAQLGRWPDPAPMDTLLKAMDAGASPGLRKRALGSVIELAGTAAEEGQAPEATIAHWMQQANSKAQSIGEKRKILGILGRLKTVESFRLLAPYLDDPDLRTEAASGVVQIAPALATGADPGALKNALEKIAATVANADLRDRALRAAAKIPSPAGSVSLFDGASLAGWEGDTNVWRVRDGVIVGGSMAGNPRNEFLATLRSYTNFVLRLDYRLAGTEGFINSGVQFRSVRLSNPPNEMMGYQADIGAGHSGCLYDESRRGKFLARASDDTIKRLEKEGDWNRYELRCEGRHIEIRLNGEQTVSYTEPDTAIPQEGLIGLQIHGGSKAEVFFRNVNIQEL